MGIIIYLNIENSNGRERSVIIIARDEQ